MRITPLIILLLCGSILILSGCDARPKGQGLILSPEQAKAQMLQVIDPRLNWAVQNQNFMVQTFNSDWQVIPTDTVELYSQARQVYLFAKGFDITQRQHYRDAAIASADFMLRDMYDTTTGNWYSSIARNQPQTRSGPKEYGTSFAIFAMAHAYRITQDKRYLDAALKTWMMGEVSVGLSLARASQLQKSNITYFKAWSINPLMHLFEALLALYDVTQSPSVWQDIEFIAQFVEDDLLQPQGYIAEYYEQINQPLAINNGGYIELGHQIEWAYLLHTAVDNGLDSRFRDVAQRLYDYAITTGWNENQGSLAARSDYEGKVIEPKPVWWAQAELLRLTAYLKNNNHDATQNAQRFSLSMVFVVNEYVDQVHGGWMDKAQSQRARISLNKVLGYHAVAAYNALHEG
ncbi:hypothetical protein BM527_13235 [Alteromonas sp. Mex14]|nr:hypothetical protein BM527_13235 [Alteromonas sp. Mex14]